MILGHVGWKAKVQGDNDGSCNEVRQCLRQGCEPARYSLATPSLGQGLIIQKQAHRRTDPYRKQGATEIVYTHYNKQEALKERVINIELFVLQIQPSKLPKSLLGRSFGPCQYHKWLFQDRILKICLMNIPCD